MAQLRSASATAPAALGSRTLLTGSTYFVGLATDGTLRLAITALPVAPFTTRILLRAEAEDFASVSGANRVLLTGSTYGTDYTAGRLNPGLYAITSEDFDTWTIDMAAALAWPLIDFHVHTHVIDDWGADAVTTLNWDPLEDAPWEFSVDALSSFAWYLTTGAAWNTDMRFSAGWELGVSHKITDWEGGLGALSVEWEPLHFDGIDDWTIDMVSSLRWVTWGNLKDGICIIATEDQVGAPAPVGGGVGTPRNHAY